MAAAELSIDAAHCFCFHLPLFPKQRTVWTADVLPAEEGGRGQVGVEGFLVAAINGGEEGVGGKGSWWWGVRDLKI
jgi:hypothetical protein